MNATIMNARIVAAAVATALALVTAPGTATADDGDSQVTRDACVGYNLGETPDQIVEGMRRNDGRLTPQEALRGIRWPIVKGECDPH